VPHRNVGDLYAPPCIYEKSIVRQVVYLQELKRDARSTEHRSLEISCVSGTKNQGIVVGIVTTLKDGKSVIHFLGRGQIFSLVQNI
jgi:hypothetical protein